ncbi:Aste57867_15674 [Aphanomyces stellatus]|uniref:Aste57867_15674 protein n=1 Tax=Aphanomyces stellatus TaxID=120398 RepID=A0A485L492_9STRA|nr:hypothetical protein As57867_015618 [Aphanomyces stellatus]VFT92468.1 Aste57867_15674 [Aphanomyces stellatus]
MATSAAPTTPCGYNVTWREGKPSVGLSLHAPTSIDMGECPYITHVQADDDNGDLDNCAVGDTLQSIKGVSCVGMNFTDVVALLKNLPKPIDLHFHKASTTNGRDAKCAHDVGHAIENCNPTTVKTTFAVSSVQLRQYLTGDHVDTMDDVIVSCEEFANQGCRDIVQRSPTTETLVSSSNGFVRGVVQAYNQHQNLELRPDDVWLAITIQFGLFVNGNAEAVRASLVKHDGQTELEVRRDGSIYTVDFGDMAMEMTQQVEEYLVDPTLSQWLLPGFSTTTDHDRIVGSVVMMASMKKYFTYLFGLCCGIPNVTLLGTVDDWLAIRSRVDKLLEFGLGEWVVMLASILDEFIDAAKGNVDTGFWQRICHEKEGGSGPSYLSGWITAFCVFNEDGKWQGSVRAIDVDGDMFESEYPIVDMDDIPRGYLTVDVKINDNGVTYDALMFAGYMAFQVKDDRREIAPHLGWALALKNGEWRKTDSGTHESSMAVTAADELKMANLQEMLDAFDE